MGCVTQLSTFRLYTRLTNSVQYRFHVVRVKKKNLQFTNLFLSFFHNVNSKRSMNGERLRKTRERFISIFKFQRVLNDF